MATLPTKPHIRLRSNGSADIVYNVVGREQVKAASSMVAASSSSYVGGSWFRLVQDVFPGAWQQNVELATTRDLLRFPPIYTCITLIADDVAKLRVKLTAQRDFGQRTVWLETSVPDASPFLRVLRKPNEYQTRVQFWQAWMVSKLTNGNTYVLKARDARGIVAAMYVLDPCRVTPLVAETGEVFYQIGRDYLSEVAQDDLVVPASEIIHDRCCAFWHPLCGIPPLYAAALTGTQGLNNLNNSAAYFGNMSRPSGLLTTPTKISKEQALALKEAWEAGYGGANQGKTAVLGDDMKFTPIAFTAEQSQQAEQANLAARWTAMAFKVPAYKLGLDSGQKFNNMAQQDADYYKQCLQILFEAAEVALDDGLGLPLNYRTEFDTELLMRMDPISRADVAQKYVQASIWAPNDAREREDMPPAAGGDEPMVQQQDFPLSVLDGRGLPAAPPAMPALPPPDTAKHAEVIMLKRALELRTKTIPDLLGKAAHG